MVELADNFKNKKKWWVDDIDRFMFYGNRDGYGYWIPSKEYDSSQYTQEDI